MGIVTQGDLVERAGLPIRLGLLREPDHAGVDDLLHSVEAGEVRGIMSTPVATVQATAAVAGAAYQMAASGLKRLPVVERAGSLVGMLSRIDVLRAITREPMGWGREDARAVTVTEPGYVRDAMERETRTVGPDAPVGDVLHTMSTTGAQRVAVTDDAGRLLGLISDRDLLPILLAPRPPGRIARLVRILGPRASGGGAPSQDEVLARRAGEVMQTALLCVHEDDTIAEAIRVMVEHRLKRLPVVDAEGAFQGMISREAVLRAGMAGSA
jgi:CBS domain-containing protein